MSNLSHQSKTPKELTIAIHVDGNEAPRAEQYDEAGNLRFTVDPNDEDAVVEWEHVHNVTQDIIQVQSLLTAIQMENRISNKRLKQSNKCRKMFIMGV